MRSIAPVWTTGSALPALLPPVSLTAMDDGDGHLRLAWQDPAAVPVGLRLLVQRGLTLVQDATLAAGSSPRLIAGGGLWHGTLWNAGDLAHARHSPALAFTLTVAPQPAALEDGRLEGLESGGIVALEDYAP